MASWFRKKRETWGLATATDYTLHLLQAGAPPLPLPLESYVSKGLQKGFVGVHDRYVITLVESTPGVIQLSMPDIGERGGHSLKMTVRDQANLKIQIEAWREKVYWWCGRLTVYRLQPQKTYRILQSFTDHYGSVFEAGHEVVFVSRNFLPYDGGHTLIFQSASIYLQEELQRDILDKFDLYFEEIPHPNG